MTNWKEIRISDLGPVITGNTPPKSDPNNYGGSYPFIKPTDMTIGQRFVHEWDETYSEKAFKRYKKAYIPPKATGVVTIGTVGEKMFLTDRDCFTNQSVNVVIPSKDYDELFVYYLLLCNLPKVANANPGTASGRHHVSKSNFCSIKVQVPENKQTQRKIASILSAYDNLIENNLKRIKLLEELAQITYEEWFTSRRINGKTVPDESIVLNRLIDLTGEYMNGGWGKEEIEEKYTKEAYVIRGTDMPDIASGNFAQIPLRFHTESNLKPRKLRFGDISIEMSNGNIGNVGRSFFFDGSLDKVLKKPFMCASFCKMLRPKTVDEAFIIDLHLKYIHRSNKMLVYKSQGANGINNFRFEDMINDEEIFVPQGEYYQALVDPIKANYELTSNLRIQISLLKEARDILLPRLMTGMIDVEQINIKEHVVSN
ncbi:MAG: restriction endonuclease subunit S [Cyclobacteriaceae bacterium]